MIRKWGSTADVPEKQRDLFVDSLSDIDSHTLVQMNTTEIENKLFDTYHNFDPDKMRGFRGLGSLFSSKPEETAESEYGEYTQAVPWVDSFMQYVQDYVQPFARIRPLNYNVYQTLQLVSGEDTPTIDKEVRTFFCPVCLTEKDLRYSNNTRYDDSKEEYLKPLFNTRMGNYVYCASCYKSADGFEGLGSLFG